MRQPHSAVITAISSCLVWCICLSSAPSRSIAQDSTLVRASDTTSKVLTDGEIILADLKESWQDAGVYFTQPLRWSGRSWAVFGGTAVGTGALMEFADRPNRDFFQRNQGSPGDEIANFGTIFGTGGIGGIAAIALYTTGLLSHDSHVRLIGRHIAQSMLYAISVTTAIKFTFGRARPYMNLGTKKFVGVTYNNDYNSLPSGHTTIATAICASLAEDLHNTWASIGLYAISASTVFGRMYSDNHWLSDTFLGAVIGTTAGYFVVHNRDRPVDPLAHDTGFRVVPSLNSLSLVYNF